MHDPRTVIVCLHRGEGLLSRLIRWQTRGEYSHASLILPDGRHVEAREGQGVLVHPRFTRTGAEAVDYFAVEVPAAGLEALEAMVAEEAGSPYDWRAVFMFLTRRTPRTPSATKWFCSELVYALLEKAGVALFRATQPWEVSPSLLGRAPALKFIRSEPRALAA